MEDDYSSDITKTISKEVIITQLNKKQNVMDDDISIDKTKIFVVHGHDDAARLEVAKFIKNIGSEPIILQEQTSDGSTIIEKLEKHSNVGFCVILYIPCDTGVSKEQKFFHHEHAKM